MKLDPAFTSEQQIIYILNCPGGHQALGHLLEIDPEKLTQSGRIDYLAALEKQNSWLNSLIQRATLAIAGNEPSEAENMWEGVDESEREDVATALRLSASTAQSRIDVARVITNHLPATCQALANGDISPSHATLIARESAEAIKRGISTEELIRIEGKALAHAEFHTPAQVGRKLRTLLAQATSESFEEAVSIARDARSVRMYPESDGMATVIALLPIEDAQTVMFAINSLIASKDEGSTKDARNIDMKRADALTEICGDALARIAADYQPHRRPVSINITMDLPTALGLAENPAHLAGYGPIPGYVARHLASDAKWRKFVTDPGTGNLLNFGRESYTPPQQLVDFLSARDQTCRFPGCSQPAHVSDIDHAIPWEEGGETSASNLGLLCRRHHRMKTHDGWELKRNPDGSCVWTSPAGKVFLVPARPIHESA